MFTSRVCPCPAWQELAAFGGRRLQPGALSYGHEDYITLVKDMGVRSIEVDVHFDPEGGESE